MHISNEMPQETRERLIKVLRAAELKVLDGSYAFVETPIDGPPSALTLDALAWVRDDEVWSRLVPSSDDSSERFKVFRFHFQAGLDNSGFVGWLATHLKATLGTGLFVVCGQNSRRGGIFDYWGCPASLAESVLAEVSALAASGERLDQPASDDRSLDGTRMSVVTTDVAGEVSGDTILEFKQNGQTICARYSGGPVRLGYLVGTRAAGKIEFRYAQVDEDGRVDGGRSLCELVVLSDGRFRLTERFQWDSRVGGGTNVFEEIRA